jgi:hypothetical protein
MPKATDKTFSIKIHTIHGGNKVLSKPRHDKKRKPLNDFEVLPGIIVLLTRRLLYSIISLERLSTRPPVFWTRTTTPSMMT